MDPGLHRDYGRPLTHRSLWQGSLLPLGGEAAPKPVNAVNQRDRISPFGSAAHSSGSKLPRHNKFSNQKVDSDFSEVQAGPL
ncbi:MAG: hypothetical protein C0411_17380 [Pseudomonas sp.]|nr:hypothetical protein [Pseudomonas sp.]